MYFVLNTNKLFNGINVHGHSHSDGSHGHSHAKPTTISYPNGHSHSHSHSHNNNNNNITTSDHAHSHSINGKKTNNYKLEHISHSNNNLNNSEIYSANQSDQVQIPIPIENCTEPEIVQSNDDSSNINLRAAAIHVIGDFIQSVGVLVAALIIYFKVYLTYYGYLI